MTRRPLALASLSDQATRDVSRRSVLKFVSLLGGGAIAAPALAACAGPKAATNAAGTAGASGAAGGRLSIVLNRNLVTLDNKLNQYDAAVTVQRAVREALTRIGSDLKPELVLAQSFEQTKPTVWTVKLRDDIRYSDKSTVKVEDVETALKMYFQVKAGYVASQFPEQPVFAKVDDRTFTLTTKNPVVSLNSLMSNILITPAAANKPEDLGSGIGTGPFTIAEDGSFSNVRGSTPLPSQTVINGKFKGAKVSGTIKDPGFVDSAKGFDCPEFNGRFSATYVKGTGDPVAPGTTLVSDDFSDPESGFATFNTADGYAEYLKDSRFRIGARTRSTSGVPLVSLRAEPERADVDLTVTTLTYAAGANDVMGLVCQATGATSFLTGLVSANDSGFATLIHYDNGTPNVLGQAPLPPGLLKTGTGAQNTLRLVCAPSSSAGYRPRPPRSSCSRASAPVARCRRSGARAAGCTSSTRTDSTTGRRRMVRTRLGSYAHVWTAAPSGSCCCRRRSGCSRPTRRSARTWPSPAISSRRGRTCASTGSAPSASSRLHHPQRHIRRAPHYHLAVDECRVDRRVGRGEVGEGDRASGAALPPGVDLLADPARSVDDHVAVVPVADLRQAVGEPGRVGLVEVGRADTARPGRDLPVQEAQAPGVEQTEAGALGGSEGVETPFLPGRDQRRAGRTERFLPRAQPTLLRVHRGLLREVRWPKLPKPADVLVPLCRLRPRGRVGVHVREAVALQVGRARGDRLVQSQPLVGQCRPRVDHAAVGTDVTRAAEDRHPTEAVEGGPQRLPVRRRHGLVGPAAEVLLHSCARVVETKHQGAPQIRHDDSAEPLRQQQQRLVSALRRCADESADHRTVAEPPCENEDQREECGDIGDDELMDFEKKALAIYEHRLKDRLLATDLGKAIAIHPGSGDYEIANTRSAASRALLRRHEGDRQIVTLRIGPPTDSDDRLVARLLAARKQ